MGLVEINYDQTDDERFVERLNYHDEIAFATIPILKRYIECPKEYRVKQLYKILLAIRGLDRPSKARIYARLNISRTTGTNSIDYLFEAGYIFKANKARLILPFQKYKQDTGYKLSIKGKAAIYAIIKASM